MPIVRHGNVFDPFPLDLWDPFFDGFPTFDSAFRSLSESCSAIFSGGSTGRRSRRPVFRVELPGARKEEVEVEVEEGRVLEVNGEERFQLSKNSEVEQMNVRLENGVLTMTVPKEEVKTNTRIDWKETPEAHFFRADIPGVRKEEVKVEVEGGRVLRIRGERRKEVEDKNDKWHRVERSSGGFMRRFRLPENSKVEQVKARLENGVLTVTVPKEPDVKSIEISGGTPIFSSVHRTK